MYKSLKKKQNLFKKLLSLYWVAFIPPTAKLMSGLSLPLCKIMWIRTANGIEWIEVEQTAQGLWIPKR